MGAFLLSNRILQFKSVSNVSQEKKGLHFFSYEELRAWSVENVGAFWESIWEFSEIVHSQKYEIPYRAGRNFTDSRFFPGAKLNFAENLLRRTDSSPALVYRGEDGSRREISYSELRSYVGALAKDLKKRGVVPGDRIAGLMPNVPETVIAMLATTAIGAIWSSCSPDFGVKGVLDRFGQITPKVLFTTDCYEFKGKGLSLAENLTRILASIPSLEAVIVSDYKKEFYILKTGRIPYFRKTTLKRIFIFWKLFFGKIKERNRNSIKPISIIRCISCIRPERPGFRNVWCRELAY